MILRPHLLRSPIRILQRIFHQTEVLRRVFQLLLQVFQQVFLRGGQGGDLFCFLIRWFSKLESQIIYLRTRLFRVIYFVFVKSVSKGQIPYPNPSSKASWISRSVLRADPSTRDFGSYNAIRLISVHQQHFQVPRTFPPDSFLRNSFFLRNRWRWRTCSNMMIVISYLNSPEIPNVAAVQKQISELPLSL